MSPMFLSSHMPCPECGESVHRDAMDTHKCDPERKATFQMFQLRDGIEKFEQHWFAFLDTNRGKFEQWLAERDVRSHPG